MSFLSSLRGQTAKALICTKSGVSADSRKSAKKCRKVRRTALFTHFLCIFCAKSAVLRAFRHFLALFLESAETPLFVQINLFAVWPLRLDRKYTRFGREGESFVLGGVFLAFCGGNGKKIRVPPVKVQT